MSLAERRRGLLPALIWSLLAAALLLSPADDLPEAVGPDWLDKPVHALLFGIHYALLARGLAVDGAIGRARLRAAGGSALYALLLETGQLWVPGRSWEWLDLVAGLVGIALAEVIAADRRARLPGAPGA